MRILYHHRIRSKDGQYVHLSELVHAFEQQGHEVTLVGPKIIEAAAFGSDGGFSDTLRKFLPKFAFELLEFAYAILAFPRLFKTALELKPDFIYERYNLYFPIGVFCARLLRIPITMEINGPLVEERQAHGGLSLISFAKWSQRYTWSKSDLTLPVTEVLAGYLRNYGVSAENILVLPNGVDLPRIQGGDRTRIRKLYSVGDDLLLGFIGFVRPWHKVDEIITAMAKGELANTQLLIVGDGPSIADLKALSSELGVQERVKFAGLVDRDSIRDYLAAFDIALQPGVTAWASPLKMIEYLAASLPIVAPDQDNIREIITHDLNGVLFDDKIPHTQIDAIRQIVESTSLRTSLGREAFFSIDRLQLTWTANARRICQRVSEIKRDAPAGKYVKSKAL